MSSRWLLTALWSVDSAAFEHVFLKINENSLKSSFRKYHDDSGRIYFLVVIILNPVSSLYGC